MLGLNETQHSERWVKTDQLFYIADNVSLKCVVTFVTHQEASAVIKTTLLVNLELVLMPIFYYCFFFSVVKHKVPDALSTGRRKAVAFHQK